MKIVFMGTPDFAVPALEKLVEKHSVAAVFTQPDKPKGRGQKLQITPVKEAAIKNNLCVYQPQRLRKDEECMRVLMDINPDLIIVIAYGQILTKEVLMIPRYGCINVHASLLPDLRGAAPINWAIIRGYKKTGLTTMLMNEGIDTGDMLLKSETPIMEDETAGELHDRLAQMGVELLIKTIEGLKNGNISPEKQDDNASSHAPMMTKELGHIDWNQDCSDVYNLIRGVTPWPGAFSYYDNRMLKFYKCRIGSKDILKGECGEIIRVSKQGIEIKCLRGSIIVNELQEVGGKRMDVVSYLNGHNINTGDKLV